MRIDKKHYNIKMKQKMRKWLMTIIMMAFMLIRGTGFEFKAPSVSANPVTINTTA